MRPVNLIPEDDRRSEGGSGRSGKLPYVLVAGLILALAVTVMYVTTSGKIDDRTAEVATLEAQEAAAAARAEALQPYTEFATLAQTREATIAQLANSRFDWERVLNELALVLPSDVWLVRLTGTVSPEVQIDGSSGVATRSEVPGPALELTGCATSQDAVAGFVSALRDIDGVTRVGLQSSALPDGESEATGGSDGEQAAAGADCQTRDFITLFELVIAFDDATTAAAGTPEAGAVPAVPAEQAATDDGGVAATQTEQQNAEGSSAEQVDEAEQGANLIPGVAR
jgi:Tfp pilus assembly protein PilN